MSYFDTSYPPSLFRLPASHDLDLVGVITVPFGLDVEYTFDSNGRPATIDFGDGESQSVADDSAPVPHTYATHGTYVVTVTSPNASDSATMEMEGAAETETEAARATTRRKKAEPVEEATDEPSDETVASAIVVPMPDDE
jgi:PKD repeat protein